MGGGGGGGGVPRGVAEREGGWCEAWEVPEWREGREEKAWGLSV